METRDLQPLADWIPPDGTPRLNGTVTLRQYQGPSVGGAITDGASVCLLRVSRFANDPDPDIDQISLSIRKHDDIHANGTPIESATTTQAGGTLTPAQLIDPGRYLPMDLPTPWPPTGLTECVAHEGLAYYVPPESYIDPTYMTGSSSQTLNNKETCMMSFVGSVGGKRIPGGRSFILRRPPVVMVHGVTSSPAVWDGNKEYEGAGAKGRWEDYDPTTPGGGGGAAFTISNAAVPRGLFDTSGGRPRSAGELSGGVADDRERSH